MNRFQEIEEKRLIDALERVCRKFPREVLSPIQKGNNSYPEVRLFAEIHGILDRLTLLRKTVPR